VRRNGGGRRAISENDPGLVPELKRLVEPATMGDPMRRLLWESKSMDKLAATLTALGHPISADTVRAELTKLGFSRQSNRKADEGSKHPDRNAQFEYINARVVATQARKQPVISVEHQEERADRQLQKRGQRLATEG
jgi:Rhodopirellula transposase DDE domain